MLKIAPPETDNPSLAVSPFLSITDVNLLWGHLYHRRYGCKTFLCLREKYAWAFFPVTSLMWHLPLRIDRFNLDGIPVDVPGDVHKSDQNRLYA